MYNKYIYNIHIYYIDIVLYYQSQDVLLLLLYVYVYLYKISWNQGHLTGLRAKNDGSAIFASTSNLPSTQLQSLFTFQHLHLVPLLLCSPVLVTPDACGTSNSCSPRQLGAGRSILPSWVARMSCPALAIQQAPPP